MKKKKILVLNGQYSPGYRGGGPTQSCINMTQNLKKYYDFYVICSDRDYKQDVAYEGIIVDEWNDVDDVKVYYMSPKNQNLKQFKKVINSVKADILYLNGFFSPIFTIKVLFLRRFNKLNIKNVILTPRGDFTGGLENKKIKKYGYIFLVKLIGLYKNLIWHATSEIEKNDIIRLFNPKQLFVVENLSAKYFEKSKPIKKDKGSIKLIFISRIFPKKNLAYALDVLKNINDGNVVFDVYGPLEDKEYWNQCEQIISAMPKNISVNYCGELEHNKIAETFNNYHAFFFPTLGENYGHIIVESMMNNCLCILSEGVTPWDEYIKRLDIGAKLSDKKEFIDIINRIIKMDNSQYLKLLKLNNNFIKEYTNIEKTVRIYVKQFDNICKEGKVNG